MSPQVEEADAVPTNLVSAGHIILWTTATAPAGGWLMCDGSAVSRTTYSSLFDEIGTTYGSGDGSTTFNVPDVRQRFPLGKADSGTGSVLGGTGGNIDHTHDAGSLSADSVNHDTGCQDGGGPALAVGHSHTSATGNSGTGNPPFLVLNFIIKT